MPCNSDHMAPNALEIYTQKVSGLIVYVSAKLERPVPEWIVKASTDIYGAVKRHNALTAILCGLCRIVEAGGEAKVNDIIYNARTKEGRELAAWWDEHKKADAERGGFDEDDEAVLVALIKIANVQGVERKAIKFAIENELI